MAIALYLFSFIIAISTVVLVAKVGAAVESSDLFGPAAVAHGASAPASAFAGAPPSSESRILVLAVTSGGLANRLRAIADWYQVATLTKRELIVSWLPTRDCNATFQQLFDVENMDIHHFRVLPFTLEAGEVGYQYVGRKALEMGLSQQVILAGGTQNFILDESVESVLRGPTNVVVTGHQGILTLKSTHCTVYSSLRSRFLSNLLPVGSTRVHLEQMTSQFFQDRLMVGFHIRWHDKLHDWEIVPPMMDNDAGGARALPFGQGATVTDFTAVMQQILSHYPADSVRFLVTSNNALVKDDILSRFGEAVVTINGPLDRTSREGMDFAALEFFALARSDLVVHTYGSTFAEEAVAMRGVPLVGIWNKARIYAKDARLAHCGHMQFMNLASQSPIPYTYTEGTEDKRSLDQPYYPIFNCPMLTEWGINDLYCARPDS